MDSSSFYRVEVIDLTPSPCSRRHLGQTDGLSMNTLGSSYNPKTCMFKSI